MTRCADGLATGAGIGAVVRSAVDQALAGMAGRRSDLAVVYVAGADPADAAAALELASTLIDARTVIGCTADAVLAAGDAESLTVAVWTASLPGATVRAFHLEVIRTPATLAVVGMPPRRDDDRCAVLLADPWTFPVDGFVSGSGEALDGLPLLGGLAGGATGDRVRLLVDGRVVDRGAVGVVLGGEVVAHAAITHATRPVGPPMAVTASEGDVVLALAGRPATRRLDEVVAGLEAQEQALLSAGVLLGVAIDEYADDHGIGDFAVQPVIEVDPATGGLVLAEHLPVGTTVRLHVVDGEASRADLEAALASLAARTVPEGALVFSGAPRSAALADPAGDAERVRDALAATGVGGLVTLGGFGPVPTGNRVLGYATSLLVLGGWPDRVETVAGASVPSTGS